METILQRSLCFIVAGLIMGSLGIPLWAVICGVVVINTWLELRDAKERMTSEGRM